MMVEHTAMEGQKIPTKEGEEFILSKDGSGSGVVCLCVCVA